MIKKQSVAALGLLLLIPVVLMLGGMVSNLIDPEIAARHANYARNFQLLTSLKILTFMASVTCAAVLWMLACFVVIRSKKRSLVWLLLAVLGPFGIAVLATLNDRAPLVSDRYARFVRSLNGYVRVGYEIGSFVFIWTIAYEAMVLVRNLTIRYEAASTGVSTAQIINLQNASSGMWAFAEGNEVMFLVAVLYLLRPMIFSGVSSAVAMVGSREASNTQI